MRKAWLALAALVVAGSLGASASTSSAKNVVLRTKGFVAHIAADGSRVAVATEFSKDNRCDRVVVWNPSNRTNTQITTSVNCESGAVNGIPEIALAGKRVVWIEAQGGNYLELALRSRVLGHKKSETIDSADNGNGAAESPDGGYLENVFGDGALLVFNSWSVCTAYPAGYDIDPSEPQCKDPAPGTKIVLFDSAQKLHKVVNGKAVEIASAPDIWESGLKITSLAVVAVDAGHIATQQPDGSVTIYSAAGSVLKKIAVPTGKFSGFALQGSQLATVRDDKLELYDVDGGTLANTLPLAAGSVLCDLQNGLAVYLNGRKIRVLRLSDGKKLTFSPPGKGSVDAQIESSGLFYSYNYKAGRSPGRVVFVPFAALLNTLGYPPNAGPAQAGPAFDRFLLRLASFGRRSGACPAAVARQATSAWPAPARRLRSPSRAPRRVASPLRRSAPPGQAERRPGSTRASRSSGARADQADEPHRMWSHRDDWPVRPCASSPAARIEARSEERGRSDPGRDGRRGCYPRRG
jgi:hypothetical protein